MNILVLNGSPRQGNTVTAIEALKKGACAHTVEVVDTYKLNVGPCYGCGVCECHRGCVAADDTNMIVNKIVDADVVVFTTPVYWWGMTAQLKLVVDKCYCRGAQLKGKKVGVIVVGGSSVDNIQYSLIKSQFECIAQYLNWDILFHQSYSASGTEDLAQNAAALSELEQCGKQL